MQKFALSGAQASSSHCNQIIKKNKNNHARLSQFCYWNNFCYLCISNYKGLIWIRQQVKLDCKHAERSESGS